MKSTRPTVGEHMSPAKHVVAPADSLAIARDVMQANLVRHLPVVEKDRVVGMITQSDLFVMESTFAVDPEKTRVRDAMSSDLYTVAPSEPLDVVAGEMARRHIGSAIVLEGGALVGLFTTTDACRILGEVLRERAGS
jgi:acetoin utilization protein AcuB